MARRGRARKVGARFKSGDIKPMAEEKVGPPALAIVRRAEVVGMANALEPEAGYALGRLLLCKLIDRRQHTAGRLFRDAWMRWASLAGLPPHEVTQRQPGIPKDVDPDEWAIVSATFRNAAGCLKTCRPWGLVWVAIETVVMDDIMPPFLNERAFAVSAIRTGLNALVEHFDVCASEHAGAELVTHQTAPVA